MSIGRRGNERRLYILAGAAYVVGLVLFFHVAVYVTDLAIAPASGTPCNTVWGPASCISRPEVIAATVFPALALVVVTWLLGRAGELRWVAVLLVAAVVATTTIVVTLKPRCGSGDRLGIITHSEGDYTWGCIGVIE